MPKKLKLLLLWLKKKRGKSKDVEYQVMKNCKKKKNNNSKSSNGRKKTDRRTDKESCTDRTY